MNEKFPEFRLGYYVTCSTLLGKRMVKKGSGGFCSFMSSQFQFKSRRHQLLYLKLFLRKVDRSMA